MRSIFAKHSLGICQGKEIISWAYNSFANEIGADQEFIKTLAFLNKEDDWDLAKAENIFFKHYRMTDKEILILVKLYFLHLLELIINRKCQVFELVDCITRINHKYDRPNWINDLNGFCIYLMPDSVLSSNEYLEIEIRKTIDELKADNKMRPKK